MIRKPVVAGMFYERDFKKLNAQIDACFKGVIEQNEKVKAIISPHAGYMFSGKAAAHSFSNLPIVDTYVIVGLSHQGFPNCVSYADFETPFGVLKNDQYFSQELNMKNDELAHQNEHSIEVQLPFLQHIHPEAKIVPILVSSHEGVAAEIARVCKELKRKIILIASSDFTHYGPSYDYVPFKEFVKKNLYKLDNKAIEFILDLDKKGFRGCIEKTGATICGKEPISVLLDYAKLIGIKKARLLDYYTSGDIVGDYSNAVGYASIVFE
ncbi:AmmeMemoRadiSam system protein B [Candidatus Woesearchaeota archaeon]|nr:AmmeMemoRadiSam system protein B [Candidatus Woesearchaeota archaeon]